MAITFLLQWALDHPLLCLETFHSRLASFPPWGALMMAPEFAPTWGPCTVSPLSRIPLPSLSHACFRGGMFFLSYADYLSPYVCLFVADTYGASYV
ncbi:hypothetical protein JB92DRAFT_2906107 [Gautieria morchelliformis]|nr:hypothetical protein JB92DRAFT_2906107 [Gautieria morchelliformis]